MPAPIQGSFTIVSTTPTVINLPVSTFTPAFMEFELGPRFSAIETWVIRSSGWQDFANNRKAAVSIYDDGTVAGTVETTSFSITHYANVGGVFTRVLSGIVSNPLPGKITYTATEVNANYIIRYKAWSA